MITMNGMFYDENNTCQFDFSKAIYAIIPSDQPFFKEIKFNFCNTDFIVETENEFIFVEYKNSNIKNAKHPDIFDSNIHTDEHYQKIAHKFYDSLLFFLLCKNNINTKPIRYVYLLEVQKSDPILRKFLREKISKKLPLISNSYSDDHISVLKDFDIHSVEEWNEQFKSLPVMLLE